MAEPTFSAPDNEGELFDDAVEQPEAYYATPEGVLADAQLSHDQKRRFLTEWARDLRERAQHGPPGGAATREAELAERIEACLAQLARTPDPLTGAARTRWRRINPAG
jgi:hypothetical protein